MTDYNQYPCDQSLCKLPVEPQYRVVYEQDDGSLSHTKSRLLSLSVNGVDIIVQQRNRSFSINYDRSFEKQNPKLVSYPVDMLALCYNGVRSHSGSVSESYRCLDTEIWFVDSRYGHIIAREIVEELAFTASAEEAAFQQPYGIAYYNKYVCDDVVVAKTETLYVIANGVKTVLKVVESESQLYSSSYPLILVYPIVPSQAVALDPEIVEHGFYDYNAGGVEDSLKMAQEDGGKDFYYPSWCRELGRINQALDIEEALHRYYTYFLDDEPPPSGVIARPNMCAGQDPDFSLATDGDGRIFYSLAWRGDVFNFLSDADLSVLFSDFPANPKFYPVGLV